MRDAPRHRFAPLCIGRPE
ncbi:hypothetical protein CCL07_02180 [Pseudomonas congelans]|nr:hypothetical protein CCL07_02180 [Pseudomonas congelans]